MEGCSHGLKLSLLLFHSLLVASQAAAVQRSRNTEMGDGWSRLADTVSSGGAVVTLTLTDTLLARANVAFE